MPAIEKAEAAVSNISLFFMILFIEILALKCHPVFGTSKITVFNLPKN